MRRLILAALLLFAPLPLAAQNEPHSWLYGSWTGGTLPPNREQDAEACYAAPTVVFTRDIVLRNTLLDPLYTQRIILTARATVGDGVEFRFRPMPRTPGQFGQPPSAGGFGCGNPDVLTVRRRGPNEIEFPGCTEFPAPLVRCPVP